MRAVASITADSATQWLREKIAVRTGMSQEELTPASPFEELGLDSTEALVLVGELEEWLGFEISPTALWYYPTIGELGEYVAEEARNNA